MFSIHLLDLEVQEFSEGEVASVYRDPWKRFEYVRVGSRDEKVPFLLAVHRLELRILRQHYFARAGARSKSHISSRPVLRRDDEWSL